MVFYSIINYYFCKGLGVGGNLVGFGLLIIWCQYQYCLEISFELIVLKFYNYINNIVLIYSCLGGIGFIESGFLVMFLLQIFIDLILFNCIVKGNVKYFMIIL